MSATIAFFLGLSAGIAGALLCALWLIRRVDAILKL